MKDFFDYASFECDCLEVSFVVVVEERQGFSRVCGVGVGGCHSWWLLLCTHDFVSCYYTLAGSLIHHIYITSTSDLCYSAVCLHIMENSNISFKIHFTIETKILKWNHSISSHC